MAKNLIRYPIFDHESDGWRDTGEGGMFFYAVWHDAEKAACHVDVSPTLHMADVLIGAHGPLASTFGDQRDAWRSASDQGDYETAWRDSAIHFDTVLLLGTTGISYFYDDYFAVRDLRDLTDEGRMLVDGISAAMGTAPTFVSYLDT